MKLFCRYRIRSLLFAVASVSVCLTVIGPYMGRRQAIMELAQQVVYVVTNSVNKEWLGSWPVISDVLITPVQAQVLIQPAAHGRIGLLRMEMTSDAAVVALKELRGNLHEVLGLNGFILVHDLRVPEIHELDPSRRKALRTITNTDYDEFQHIVSRLCSELQTFATPCGHANFPDASGVARTGEMDSADF